MPLEVATYISDLEPANPAPTDQLAQADEHLRLIKSVLQSTFPNLTGPVTASQDALNSPFALPIGSTILWYGSAATVPGGWHICDGSTVIRSDGGGNLTLPDMRDKVAIGVGTGLATTVGATVGASTSSASTGTAGSHTHTTSGGDHSHTGSVDGHSLTSAEVPSHFHYGFAAGTVSFGSGLSEAYPPSAITDSGNSGSAYIGPSTGTATVGRTSTYGGGNAHSHPLTVDTSSHAHTVSTDTGHSHSVSISTVQPCVGFHYIMKT